MKRFREFFLPLVCAAVCATPFTSAHGAPVANPILDWNTEVVNATRLSRNPPPIAALHLATYHLALYDTVNSFTRTHQPWLVKESAPAGADMDAAIAAAAYAALGELWGKAANPYNFKTAYDRALAAIADGPAKDAGLAWGREVASRILAERAACALPPPEGVYSSDQPGLWRETPSGFRPPVTPRLCEVKPFALESASQFRAPPPPALDSLEYAQELEQIKRIGARDNAERTEYQTLSTPFWSDDLGSATPPGHWNTIAQDLARRHNLSTADAARLFALLNICGADAGITCWETKFHYRTWRPETAIRELTPELNPHFKADPEFIPNMGSPAFPSYTSGHSTYTAAMTRVIELFFGRDDIEFTATSDGLPGAVRTYQRLSEARDEVGMSRLWGGIHVMSDNLEGQKAGLKVADWIFAHTLLPLQPPAG